MYSLIPIRTDVSLRFGVIDYKEYFNLRGGL